MTLDALSPRDMAKIREERNALPPGILRTPFVLTEDQQLDWYHKEICDRRSTTRYWALRADQELLGYGGIENIQWEAGIGEMSLMIVSEHRGKGYGSEAVILFLKQAFEEMGLDTVYAEVYECNPNLMFWQKQDFDQATYFPRRKRMGGKLYDSQIFVWTKEDWNAEHK